MSVAPYRVHKLIQDLMRNPEAAAAFAADPEPTFTAYELAETEKRLLRDGSPAALHELGVHPNLQMKYLRLRAPPKSGGPGLLDAYLDRLKER
jgi:hypothetical protein